MKTVRSVALGLLITVLAIPTLCAVTYGFILLLFLVMGLVGYGNHGAGITIENKTAQTVVLYSDGHPFIFGDGDIPPGESTTVAVPEDSWEEHLTALDENKQPVWQADITWDQVEEMGDRIVIEPMFPAPTVQPTPRGTSSPGS